MTDGLGGLKLVDVTSLFLRLHRVKVACAFVLDVDGGRVRAGAHAAGWLRPVVV